MVTNIHTKARILLKVFNVYRSENLALFTVTSICSIWKSTKKQKFLNKKEGNRNVKAHEAFQ